jgi:uncharacterized protein (TIRG00374 family)
MNVRGAVLSLVVVTAVYLAALVWIDARTGMLRLAPQLVGVLGVMIGLTVVSWLLRFLRWHWLMRRAGFSPCWWRALLAYLSGFAFTATPGKVGELIRIRYFVPMGVPAGLVVGLFVYERCLDLLVVLLISTIVVGQFDQFWVAAAFVAVLVATVLLVARNSSWMASLAAGLARRNLRRPAQAIQTLAAGLADARQWANWRDFGVSLLLGLIAWGLVALSFAWLLGKLGLSIPLPASLAIFPLSMLVGAASMLPGGLGSTEATVVALLVLQQVPVEIAVLAAVAARLSSLWSAILAGLICLAVSEARRGSEGVRDSAV